MKDGRAERVRYAARALMTATNLYAFENTQFTTQELLRAVVELMEIADETDTRVLTSIGTPAFPGTAIARALG